MLATGSRATTSRTASRTPAATPSSTLAGRRQPAVSASMALRFYGEVQNVEKMNENDEFILPLLTALSRG
jgi:hypothetical protein